MVVGLIAGLAVTFTTAFVAFGRLTRQQWHKLRASRKRYSVLVVGASKEADIVSRDARNQGLSVLQVQNDGGFVVDSWPDILKDRLVAAAVKNVEHVVIAGEDETVNATIARDLLAARPGLHQRIHAIVRSRELATAIRPTRIDLSLPPINLFSPMDNIGQRVAEVMTDEIDYRKDHVRVLVDVDEVVARWLSNAATARSELGLRPSFEFNNDGQHDLAIVQGVRALTTIVDSSTPTIAIVDADLVETIPWLQSRVDRDVFVVDPTENGLSLAMVTSGLQVQWARAFHHAHAMLHNDAPRWQSARHTRNEQLSTFAVMAMLRFLRQHNFELATHGNPAIISKATALSIASFEHEDWLHGRTWIDSEGTKHPAPEREDGSWSPDARPWDELSTATRAYLTDIPMRVYPALAAMLGYIIRERSAV